MDASLRIEIFPADVEVTTSFYERDFRVTDPDGYYLRFTGRRHRARARGVFGE